MTLDARGCAAPPRPAGRSVDLRERPIRSPGPPVPTGAEGGFVMCTALPGRVSSRRIATLLFGSAFVALAASPPASAQTPLVLGADTQLPAIGASVRLDLDGAPGSHFQLKMSLAPHEADTIFGTVFL